MSFDAFSFHPTIIGNLKKLQFVDPTPIQADAIPKVLDGGDLVGIARTGTGKTGAFLLPMIQRLLSSKVSTPHPRALVIAPTRELAEQIKEVAVSFVRGTNIRVGAVYGGVSMRPQVERFRRGCDLVIACPGRLLDHMQGRTVDLREVEMLVLDEADQMFDMGFFPTIRRILQSLPKKRQTLLFSATMPSEIRKLAAEFLHDPATVQVGTIAPVDTVAHALYPVAQHLKTPFLIKLLRSFPTESVLIFTRTKHRAKRLEEVLQKEKFEVASLHGNLSQSKRQASMSGFRSGKYQILVATDIAARGVDISTITHVVNYDIPNTTDAYTHRIGRTGRAQKTGDAVTLISREDEGMVRQIERVLKRKIERKSLEGFDYKASAPAGSGGQDRDPRERDRGERRSRPGARQSSWARPSSRSGQQRGRGTERSEPGSRVSGARTSRDEVSQERGRVSTEKSSSHKSSSYRDSNDRGSNNRRRNSRPPRAGRFSNGGGARTTRRAERGSSFGNR